MVYVFVWEREMCEITLLKFYVCVCDLILWHSCVCVCVSARWFYVSWVRKNAAMIWNFLWQIQLNAHTQFLKTDPVSVVAHTHTTCWSHSVISCLLVFGVWVNMDSCCFILLSLSLSGGALVISERRWVNRGIQSRNVCFGFWSSLLPQWFVF